MKYAVIVDAGSSGSRIYVYRWPDPVSFKSHLGDSPAADILLPIESNPEWITKIRPGISSYADNPSAIWKEHLAPLIRKAHEVVPRNERSRTPFFFLATAGLRLVPDEPRGIVLETVCNEVRRHTSFYLPECDTHISMIDGETEGLYGWLGLNYLVHSSIDSKWSNFDQTYGFMDMGGASSQIAFVPNVTETQKHENDLYTLNVRTVAGAPVSWKVSVTTWLGFGANQAQKRFREQLINNAPKDALEPGDKGQPIIVNDPCLPPAAMDHQKQMVPGSSDKKEVIFFGTGDFSTCEKELYPLLNAEKQCDDEPCLFDGKHVPAFDLLTQRFVGISEYWYTAQDLFQLNGKFDYASYLDHTIKFCTTHWSDIIGKLHQGEYGNMDEANLYNACFKSSWVLSILNKGFNFPLNPVNPEAHHDFLDTFQSAVDIDGVELSWTLGRAVLYASSQIEPRDANAAEPVGLAPYGAPFVLGGELSVSPLPSAPARPTLWPFLFVALLVGLVLSFRKWAKYLPARFKALFSKTWGYEPVLPVSQEDPIPLADVYQRPFSGASTSLPPSSVPSRVSSRVNMRDWE